MSDLFQGQTMTYGFKFVAPTPIAAHTFTFPFQPDRVTFYNYSKYGTSDKFVQSTWFRGFPAGDALQIGVGTAPAAKIALETTNGFTVADTAGGATDVHLGTISAITAADPVVVTVASTAALQTNQIVRFTNLGVVISGPPATDNGMGQLNNKRFKIVVLNSTTFSLKDPVSGEPVDGTAFTAYVSGGKAVVETRVISLNNPQVSPYSDTNPYHPNQFKYDPVTYKLTAGTAVLITAGDIYYGEAIKYGTYENLGTLT